MPVDVRAEVLANRRLSDDYNLVALAAPAIAAEARPGQFVMLKPREGLDPLLRRPFSIFETLRDEEGRPAGLTLLNKRIGTVTGQVYALQAGERVDCLGPLGQPWPDLDPRGDGWMVAGGVGLAPFASLAASLAARGVTPVLFYGARCAADLFGREAFERLGVEIVLATEDGSAGSAGFVTVPLAARLAAAPADRTVTIYACGPTPMMRAVASLAETHGRRCLVSLEQVMGCGLGGCYSCVVRVRTPDGPHFVRSCVGGPVFDGRDLVWDELRH
jgi:dihydroorotate dehydrogenase electron transfer subunit